MRRIILKSVFRLTVLLSFFAANPAFAQDFEASMIGSGVPTGWGVTGGDFDGDGDIDFAASGKQPGIVIWFETRFNNPPLEHFLYSVGGHGARYITSADIDNDDDIDLIVAGYGEDRFIWFENRGADFPDRFEIHSLQEGTYGAWQAVPLDLDNNGTMDIATCSYNGNSMSLLLTSAFGEHSVLMSAAVQDPIGLHAVDFDRDGDMDLLIASSNTTRGGIYWLEQTSPLQFELQELYVESGVRLTSLCSADMDGDQDVDIVATRVGGVDGVTWWENDADGFIQHDLDGYMYLPRNVVAVDFDDDDLIDIAATWHGSSTGMGAIYWWKNLGGGAFERFVIHDGDSPYDLHLIDFDLDGDEDLLAPLSAIGEIYLFRNLLGTTALIQGMITSRDNGLPVQEAFVAVEETGASALTDITGFYRINTTPGIYSVRIRHDCWEDRQLDNIEAIEDSTEILNVELRRPLIFVNQSSLSVQVRNQIESMVPLIVRNTGDGTLNIHAEIIDSYVDEDWLNISPLDAELQPGAEISFQVTIAPDTSNLAAWDYYGEIVLHSNACPDTVLYIPVFAHVLDVPGNVLTIPTTTKLYPAYPNPFNSSTRIRFALAVPGEVTIDLYDIQGRRTMTLYSASAEAGVHDLIFSGGDLASGVYFIRMISGQNNYTQKLHLLK